MLKIAGDLWECLLLLFARLNYKFSNCSCARRAAMPNVMSRLVASYLREPSPPAAPGRNSRNFSTFFFAETGETSLRKRRCCDYSAKWPIYISLDANETIISTLLASLLPSICLLAGKITRLLV